jgi:uncharacterized protein YndB with AHSA1/START domain
MANVTVKDSVHIDADPATVWDYTQDWSRRQEWDPAVRTASYRERGDAPVVEMSGAGGMRCVVRYKQSERPHRTSVAMTEITPRWMTGGGGAWSYEAEAGGTRFTQTNTLQLGGLAGALFGPLVRWQLARATRQALRRAKAILERKQEA